MPQDAVYKIFRPHEWRQFDDAGRFAGSPDDVRDGFIHLSYASQVPGTLEKHYALADEVVLAAFDAAGLAQALKAEISREGALFPHYHGMLERRDLLRFAHLVRQNTGFVLPAWCSGAV
jgi:uncharacterized protein (DUF952 family)